LHWFKDEKKYRRFPVNPVPALPEIVEELANHTAGGQLKFVTDSKRIALRVSLREVVKMDNVVLLCHSGFDLYCEISGEHKFFDVTRFDPAAKEYFYEFKNLKSKAKRNLILNFPLYNGFDKLEIGIEKDAVLESPVENYQSDPIVIYGTSITQGACASRPGMCYTNILTRKLNIPIINLGFSGGGKGEPEVAKHIASIDKVSLFILDYEANCDNPQMLADTLPVFVDILRNAHPGIPIVIISKIPYPQEIFDNEIANVRKENRDIQFNYVKKQNAKEVKDIYFIDGESLLQDDYWECSGDGGHPSNLGFYRIAENLLPEIKKILLKYPGS
jgi:lysophospholipase L1-like esterase